MHFDDRLATVLRTRAASAAIARIQYRQLIDLLGTTASDARSPTVDAAYVRLGELSQSLSVSERGAVLDDRAVRLRSPRAVAELLSREPAVAMAALDRAELDEEQWLDLVPALPLSGRSLLRHRQDLGPRVDELLDRLGVGAVSLPLPDNGVVQPEPARRIPADNDLEDEPHSSPLESSETGIGALVRRIEAFRRNRPSRPLSGTGPLVPRLPFGEENEEVHRATAFDFHTDPGGRIVSSDPGVAPMVVGMSLVTPDGTGAVNAGPELAAGFRRRQPLRALALNVDGAPAVAGTWQLDAAPLFEPETARFLGYRGRMRRPAPTPAESGPTRSAAEGDRMRQLLHELRTPVNAIQGFAEIIQQQLFGPTPHEYRALAASIAGDAARMLAGFEELERLARLETGVLQLQSGAADLGEILKNTVEQLRQFTGPRGGGFHLHCDARDAVIPLTQADLERLSWRILATLAGAANPGEWLAARVTVEARTAVASFQLPAQLAAHDDEALFNAAAGALPQALSAGMFGTGFALRLAASEARSAGGSLGREGGSLLLRLPVLTHEAADHSPDVEQGAGRNAGGDPR